MNRMQKLWIPMAVAVVAGCDAGPVGPALQSEVDFGYLPQVEVSLPDGPVGGLGGGESRDPAELAARWIDYAQALLRQAIDLAGPGAEPRVIAALREAEHLLDQAVRAFEVRDFDRAIRHAQASASLSQRVIRYLTDDGRPGRERERPEVERERPEQDRPDRERERSRPAAA